MNFKFDTRAKKIYLALISNLLDLSQLVVPPEYPLNKHCAENAPLASGNERSNFCWDRIAEGQVAHGEKQTYERLGSWHAWCKLYPAIYDLRCRLRVTLES